MAEYIGYYDYSSDGEGAEGVMYREVAPSPEVVELGEFIPEADVTSLPHWALLEGGQVVVPELIRGGVDWQGALELELIVPGEQQ